MHVILSLKILNLKCLQQIHSSSFVKVLSHGKPGVNYNYKSNVNLKYLLLHYVCNSLPIAQLQLSLISRSSHVSFSHSEAARHHGTQLGELPMPAQGQANRVSASSGGTWQLNIRFHCMRHNQYLSPMLAYGPIVLCALFRNNASSRQWGRRTSRQTCATGMHSPFSHSRMQSVHSVHVSSPCRFTPTRYSGKPSRCKSQSVTILTRIKYF